MIYERITPLSDEEIERGRKKDPAPGYPDTAHRLKIPPQQLQRMIAENRIEIPDEGEAHFIYNHPNRVNGMAKGRRVERIITNKAPASDQEGQKWRNMGLYTDTANRALHPRFFQLLTTPDVGMYTGPGFYYGNGPQRIAN